MSNTLSFSYSGYSAAVSCLRKFQLVYVDRLVPEGPQSGDLLFGSALHSAINGILTGHNGEELFELYWGSYKEKEVAYGRFKWEELNQLGLGFCSKFARLHAPKYRLEFAEERLYGEYKGIKLEGTPDFYGTYKDQKSLRDFKTSGYAYDKAKADVALQLNLYTYLAHVGKGLPFPETLGYTVFNKGVGSIQDLSWPFSEKKMYEQLDALTEYCKLIGATDHGFPKNPNACLYPRQCEWFTKCWGGETK